MDLDMDINMMTRSELKVELQQLRDAVRLHRNEKGHGRCWLDDQTLYQKLPENKDAEFALPPKEEFLANCEVYWRTRQPTMLPLAPTLVTPETPPAGDTTPPT